MVMNGLCLAILQNGLGANDRNKKHSGPPGSRNNAVIRIVYPDLFIDSSVTP
ncbi:hypothetical protein D3C78_1708340 [compost metagenome]